MGTPTMGSRHVDGHKERNEDMVDARKVHRAKRAGLAVAGISLLCSFALSGSPALAVPYTHSEAGSEAAGGLIHVAVTLDCTAVGGSIKAVWLPLNGDYASVEAVMNEFLTASEDKVDPFAHADYELQSLGEFLADKTYTVDVYKAGSQAPGAVFSYTGESVGDETYDGLEKGDGVYVTVTE